VDIQIVGPMWAEFGKDCCKYLEGMFGIVLYNKKTGEFFIARDHMGMVPVYIGVGPNGEKYVSSEMKTICEVAVDIQMLEPGHYITNDWQPTRWYNPTWDDLTSLPSNPVDYKQLRQQITDSVQAHLMTDVPFGVMLSGGLGSSLIAAITMELLKEGKVILKDGKKAVKTFTIGEKDSPDILAARKVAEFLGTDHHEIILNPEECFNYVNDAVFHTETYDPLTIKMACPMLVLQKKIKEAGMGVILSGEGVNELFGGLPSFKKAENEMLFHAESVKRLGNLYKSALMRGDKCAMVTLILLIVISIRLADWKLEPHS